MFFEFEVGSSRKSYLSSIYCLMALMLCSVVCTLISLVKYSKDNVYLCLNPEVSSVFCLADSKGCAVFILLN